MYTHTFSEPSATGLLNKWLALLNLQSNCEWFQIICTWKLEFSIYGTHYTVFLWGPIMQPTELQLESEDTWVSLGLIEPVQCKSNFAKLRKLPTHISTVKHVLWLIFSLCFKILLHMCCFYAKTCLHSLTWLPYCISRLEYGLWNGCQIINLTALLAQPSFSPNWITKESKHARAFVCVCVCVRMHMHVCVCVCVSHVHTDKAITYRLFFIQQWHTQMFISFQTPLIWYMLIWLNLMLY